MEVSEKFHSEDGYNFCLAFLFSAALYKLFVNNHIASCIDKTSKLNFFLATDIAIPCNYVNR